MKVKQLVAGYAVLALAQLGLAGTSEAHFGTIIPSDDIVSQTEAREIALEIKFIHPMEGQYMELARPRQFGVVHRGTKTDLLPSLVAARGSGPDQTEEFTFWATGYRITRPGDYTFFVEPQPYWEAAEDVFIVHYTKVCVNALGLEAGWDEPVGLETEIIPLSRPYGLWTNNLFTGQVLLHGKPAPFAEVEIEYLNESAGNPSFVRAPAEPYVTQLVKADERGIFSYAMVRAGWWGFAALSEADWKLNHEDAEKEVEIGAVYWVHTSDMK